IADDVTYFDEPFFQDGLLSQAVNSAYAAGVAYFSAAGNSGSNGYDNLAPDFSTPAVAPAGEHVLNFDTTGATTTTSLTVNLPQFVPGEFVNIILQWDQPYVTGAPTSSGATSQMDLCVASPTGTGLIASPVNPDPGSPSPIDDLTSTQVCTGANSTGVDPYQVLVIGYPANATTGSTCPPGLTSTVCSAAQTITVQVGLVGGVAPTRIKVAVDDDGAGSTFTGVPVTGGTLQGHPGAAGVMAVGAVFWGDTPACGKTTAVLETFSAKGGDPILFGSSGNPLNPPDGEMRQKPDIAGPDGGSDTFLGFALGAGTVGSCNNSGSFPNFFGTSAATPHVAATAALLLQQFPGINPGALYTALKSGAGEITNYSQAGSPPAVNYTGGYGLLQAENALAALPAAPDVSLNLSPTTVNVGASAKLSWTVSNATTCTASGAWSGTQALSGSMMITPSATGSATYNLTCTNASGYAEATQVLTVTDPSGGGGGGGGALDLASLAALAALAGVWRRRRRS
ncbi:MAG TPA: S8 family serine peptidase, partial [Steroidobacteraceae bacterium]|nr:S8 family serine peptidase [Steroidobacteraceae bacterium]